MNTVNVIEITDTRNMSVDRLIVFPDTEEGNKQAEKLFEKLIIHHNSPSLRPEDVDKAIEDGLYWEWKGTYYFAIVHSTN